MNGEAGHLDEARDAFARRNWVRARDGFIAARAHGPLSSDDTYALADAAWWLGLIDEALARYEDAYRLYLDEERPRQAAVTAFGIGYTLALRGDSAVGSGWMGRAVRLLEGEAESAEHGYLVFIDLEEALGAGDLETALARARDLQAMGRRFADSTLVALGVVGEGRALIKQGQVRRGLALLDEGMLAAVSERMDPSWAGNIYCSVMIACHELADVRRAAEWTQATARWCESMPAAGPFMGICRVHRAQILQIQGGWDEAEREADRVCRELAHFDVGTVAEAHYQMGEVHRLRGSLAAAEEAYRRAHALGRDPQPGLALLRLAQGRAEAAAASIQAALAGETRNRLARALLCAAQVEIALAAGTLDRARQAGDELAEIAAVYGSSGFEAVALSARGAIQLTEGQTAAALQTLRTACLCWQRLNAPYETARIRVLLARAYAALADPDASSLELDAAAAVFDRLGALPDARAVADLRGRPSLPGGLTEREAEVLAEVAAGKSNREIAGALFISEKTVARHLSNIFTKLGLTSRTAAAAYAIEHGLAVRGRG
jgi:DNA-binding CsgD family transcriptional regulator